jgi:uncharacterized UPF0146 family protein
MGLPLKLFDTEDIADFITLSYSDAETIIEVGVGVNPWVSKLVKERLPKTRVIVTDVDKEKLIYVRKLCPNLELMHENILEPHLKVYYDANLVFSIRPPPELVPELFRLSQRVGCNILIRPYSSEEGGYNYLKIHGWRFISHGQTSLYWLRKKLDSTEPAFQNSNDEIQV